MTSLKRNLLLLFLAVGLGLAGCNQSASDARATKLRQLENRYTKLDEDYRTTVADMNGVRKKLAEAEKQLEEAAKQNQELQAGIKERDELQQRLNVSLGERDALRVELTSFGKELQALTARVQQVAGSGNSSGLVTTVSQQKQK